MTLSERRLGAYQIGFLRMFDANMNATPANRRTGSQMLSDFISYHGLNADEGSQVEQHLQMQGVL